MAETPFPDLRGSPAGILILRALKAERIGQLLSAEVWDEKLISAAPVVFEAILRYILASGEFDKTAFADRVRVLHNPHLQQTAMTLAQQFREEGRQEGRQEGQRQAIVKILELRYKRVPVGLLEAIEEIGAEKDLDRLLAAATTCETLEEFSENL